MMWSNHSDPMQADDDTPTMERVSKIDMRARKMFFKYEVRTKGRYKVDILLDEVAIPGCPIEFYVRHRAPG